MQKWMRWTVLVATIKTVVRVLQKILGSATQNLPAITGIAAIGGAMQWGLGALARAWLSEKIKSDAGSKWGAVAFGCGALVCNISALAAFQYGGSVIVVTFISTLSIVPGALLDRFWFKHALGIREWLGLTIGILGGHAILGFPSLAEALRLPVWVWFAFGNTIGLAFNQFIVQTTKRIHPYAQNMWGGGTLAIAALLVGILGGGAWNIAVPSLSIYVGASVIVGIATFFMWSFSLFAYKEGAFISLKKLVMNGSYLTMTVALGVLLFGESIQANHFIGFALYLVALVLMDSVAWNALRALIVRKPVGA